MQRRRNNLDLIMEKVKQMQNRKEAAKKAKRPSSFAEIQKVANNTKQNNNKFPVKKENKVQPRYSPREKPYVQPTIKSYHVPAWFTNTEKVDVSIIVPMYKSSEVIAEQIKNWNFMDDGLKKEIIYVNDGCPESSSDVVVSSWEMFRNHAKSSKEPINHFNKLGRIINLSHNAGFSNACNMGSQTAKGDYLIFLNADTMTTPNWIKPMIDLLSDQIGLVGNLQLKYNGNIDSAGSEWSSKYKTFLHIGRDIYQGKRLNKPIHISDIPEDLLIASERDMVTGCCMAIKKTLFDAIGGFDIGYRVGYWEDSDLNMEVKSRGYKIYYQPESIIYHKGSHTKSGNHPFILANTERFHQKWGNKLD